MSGFYDNIRACIHRRHRRRQNMRSMVTAFLWGTVVFLISYVISYFLEGFLVLWG